MALPNPDDIAAIWQLLGFDPESTQAVVMTPNSAVAIAIDYPEPRTQPDTQEVPDASV